MAKLYYSLQRASEPTTPDPWQIPGAQDKKAERVDIPSPPAELAAWLNARRVPIAAIEAAPTAGEQPETGAALGPATKEPPRYDPKYHDEIGKTDFVPVAHAAEIDRLLQRCPKCHGGALANVMLWIGEASLDELHSAAEAIKRRVQGVADEIEGSTKQ